MKVTIIATITAAAQTRQNGDSLQARLGVSVTEFWTSQSGTPGSRVTPITIDARGRFAESIANATPGEKLFAIGDLGVRPFHNRNGEFHAPLTLRPYELRMLGVAQDEDYIGVEDIGNLGRDPEMRYLDSGDPVSNFSIAINTVSGSGENRQEYTQWVDVAVFGDTAENVNNYLARGSTVQVSGSRLEARTWKTQSGEDRAGVQLTARRVQFLSRANNGNGGAAGAPADAAPAHDDSADDMPWA